jgi:hypothetical protein
MTDRPLHAVPDPDDADRRPLKSDAAEVMFPVLRRVLAEAAARGREHLAEIAAAVDRHPSRPEWH